MVRKTVFSISLRRESNEKKVSRFIGSANAKPITASFCAIRNPVVV